jgi:hypothetical protein
VWDRCPRRCLPITRSPDVGDHSIFRPSPLPQSSQVGVGLSDYHPKSSQIGVGLSDSGPKSSQIGVGLTNQGTDWRRFPRFWGFDHQITRLPDHPISHFCYPSPYPPTRILKGLCDSIPGHPNLAWVWPFLANCHLLIASCFFFQRSSVPRRGTLAPVSRIIPPPVRFCQGKSYRRREVQLATGTTVERPQAFGSTQKERVDAEPRASITAICAIAGIGS